MSQADISKLLHQTDLDFIPGKIETKLQRLPPLALYIHFPWCIKKCPYCDFNSHQIKNNTFPENQYIDALLSDIETALPTIYGRKIYSIFFGGGTPSLFSISGFDKFMSKLRSILPIHRGIEITMEANPSTLDQTRFQAFHDIGINRLSIGIQSFSDKKLMLLGRSHNSKNAKKAIETALNIYSNINLDIMYGLPYQSIEECNSDITTALSYKTQHVSFYHLTIEPNTFFAVNPPNLPEEDIIDMMQESLKYLTKKAGLFQYEVSAFAKKNYECKHNKNYWTFGDYLGIGAGSHSKITLLGKDNKLKIFRQVRWKHPKKYIDFALKKNPLESHQKVSSIDLPFEYMLNALRLYEGFHLDDFVKRTGRHYNIILSKIQEAINKGLLTVIKNHSDFSQKKEKIVPTELGKRFLNDLQQIFLPNNK